MSTLEALLLIFVIIETLQVFFLLRNNIKMKNLIAEILTNEEYAATVAKNMVFGFMEDVINDKEKADTFFQFVASCGINAAVGIRNYFGSAGEGAPGVKLKARSPFKPFEGLINQVLPGVIDKIVKGKANQVAEKVLDSGLTYTDV